MPEVLYFCFAKSTFSAFSGFHTLFQTKRENYNGYHSPYSADLTFESKDDRVVENNGGYVHRKERITLFVLLQVSAVFDKVRG